MHSRSQRTSRPFEHASPSPSHRGATHADVRHGDATAERGHGDGSGALLGGKTPADIALQRSE